MSVHWVCPGQQQDHQSYQRNEITKRVHLAREEKQTNGDLLARYTCAILTPKLWKLLINI